MLFLGKTHSATNPLRALCEAFHKLAIHHYQEKEVVKKIKESL